MTFRFPARHVEGHRFESSGDLEKAFNAALAKELTVTLSAE